MRGKNQAICNLSFLPYIRLGVWGYGAQNPNVLRQNFWGRYNLTIELGVGQGRGGAKTSTEATAGVEKTLTDKGCSFRPSSRLDAQGTSVLVFAVSMTNGAN